VVLLPDLVKVDLEDTKIYRQDCPGPHDLETRLGRREKVTPQGFFGDRRPPPERSKSFDDFTGGGGESRLSQKGSTSPDLK
jgi:hypothetical protein